MARFRINPTAVQELRRSPEIRTYRTAKAAEVAERAQQLGPVVTGAYNDSVFADSDADLSVVGTTDAGGLVIEIGSVNNPAYSPLRRGALAAGLRFDTR